MVYKSNAAFKLSRPAKAMIIMASAAKRSDVKKLMIQAELSYEINKRSRHTAVAND